MMKNKIPFSNLLPETNLAINSVINDPVLVSAGSISTLHVT